MKVVVAVTLGMLAVLAAYVPYLHWTGSRAKEPGVPVLSGVNMKQSGSTQTHSKSGYDIRQLASSRIDELAKNLSPQERQILLSQGTESPFCGGLLDQKDSGSYTCRLCGLPLFGSGAKFTSGTGWPSFFQPFDPAHIHYEPDNSTGIARTEIQCTRCRSHLGHVFDDGPPPTGRRYCLNSAALRFFAQDAALPPESQPIDTETAYFAGGCFWGLEDRFQQVPGVVDAVSGYMGGAAPNPTYKQVCSGESGHAETVRVTYDPGQVTYAALLESFFNFHDATQLNRQGPDIGTQYRSAIFTTNEEQSKLAQQHIDKLERSEGLGGQEVVTTIEPAGGFHEAEEYHQDYHARHGGSCALPTD